MKLKDLQTNDRFITDSGVTFKLLPMSNYEKRAHPDRFKAFREDTKEVFYLIDNMGIRKI